MENTGFFYTIWIKPIQLYSNKKTTYIVIFQKKIEEAKLIPLNWHQRKSNEILRKNHSQIINQYHYANVILQNYNDVYICFTNLIMNEFT